MCDCGINDTCDDQLILSVLTILILHSLEKMERSTGTKSQDAFYVMTVDTDLSLLKGIMVGADVDREMLIKIT